MKSALLFLALLTQSPQLPPDIPLAAPDPSFPLHLHVIAVRSGQDHAHLYRTLRGQMNGGPGYYQPEGSYHGFGIANLTGNDPQGLDFAFDCPASFEQNRQPSDTYQARWKRPGERLEILTQTVGSDKANLCELKVAVKPHPFDLTATKWAGASQTNGVIWDEPETSYSDPDPDYPVHLHIISSFRNISPGETNGYGTANLLGDSPQGVDFTYSCSQGLMWNNQPDDFYQGHWVKQDQRLEVLLQRLGSDHVDKCDLKTTLKTTPYPDHPSATASTTPAPILRTP